VDPRGVEPRETSKKTAQIKGAIKNVLQNMLHHYNRLLQTISKINTHKLLIRRARRHANRFLPPLRFRRMRIQQFYTFGR
jgi:hypothetical protein